MSRRSRPPSRRPLVPRTLAPGYCYEPGAAPVFDDESGIHRRAELVEHVPASEVMRERRIRAEVLAEFREAGRLHR